MARILLPEDEVTVTPGAKAVEDLMDLPGPLPVEFFLLGTMDIPLSSKAPTTETRKAVSVCNQALSDREQTRFGYEGAVYTAHSKEGYIPSAPLLLGILHELHVRGTGSYGVLLDRIQETMTRGLHTNTEIRWKSHYVVHYSLEKKVVLGMDNRPFPSKLFIPKIHPEPVMGYDAALEDPDYRTLVESSIGVWEKDQLSTILGEQTIVLLLPERSRLHVDTSVRFLRYPGNHVEIDYLVPDHVQSAAWIAK